MSGVRLLDPESDPGPLYAIAHRHDRALRRGVPSESVRRDGRRLRHLGLLLACVMLAGVAACTVGPFARGRVTETYLQPQAIRLLGEGGDPLVVMVGVLWAKDGYCSGQFTARATETATEIRVGTVKSREHSSGDCAGVGTWEDMAFAELRLASPVGDRVVVRDSDGASLPILAS